MDEQRSRDMLNKLKEGLLEDLQRGEQAAGVVELEQNKVGRLSRMDAMQQQAMQKASQDLIRKRLVQVERALDALNEGDYGYCHECGEDIAAERLEVRPETLVCVACQEKLENQKD